MIKEKIWNCTLWAIIFISFFLLACSGYIKQVHYQRRPKKKYEIWYYATDAKFEFIEGKGLTLRFTFGDSLIGVVVPVDSTNTSTSSYQYDWEF